MSFERDSEFERLLRPLSPEERADLKQLIEQYGVDPGTVALIGGRKYLIDGYNRDDICRELGIPFPYRVVPFPDRESAMEWMKKNQGGRRNLSLEEMQRLRAERIERVVAARQEGAPIRQIAEQEAVSPAQVRKDLQRGGAGPRPAPRPQNGQPRFDWKEFYGKWRSLYRSIDDLARPFRALDSPSSEGLRRRLAEWKGQFKDVFKELTKRTPPPE